MDSFLLKSHGILIIREIREKFPRKIYFGDKFCVGFFFKLCKCSETFSHFFLLWVLSFSLDFCFKDMNVFKCNMFLFKSNMLDCWMRNYKRMNYLLNWLSYTVIKAALFGKLYFILLQVSKKSANTYNLLVTSQYLLGTSY